VSCGCGSGLEKKGTVPFFIHPLFHPCLTNKPNSYKKYVRTALKPLLKHFKEKKLLEISPFLIEKYKKERKEEIQRGEGRISLR